MREGQRGLSCVKSTSVARSGEQVRSWYGFSQQRRRDFRDICSTQWNKLLKLKSLIFQMKHTLFHAQLCFFGGGLLRN